MRVCNVRCTLSIIKIYIATLFMNIIHQLAHKYCGNDLYKLVDE